MTTNNNSPQYIPEAGDLFSWIGREYWCIESSPTQGVVNPINETFYVMNFEWGFKGIPCHFIRKGSERELERMGTSRKKKATAMQELAEWLSYSFKLEGYEHRKIIEKCQELLSLEKQQITDAYLHDGGKTQSRITDANTYYETHYFVKSDSTVPQKNKL